MLKLLLFADSNSIHTKQWVEILKDNYEIHLISFSTSKIIGVNNYNIPVGKIKQTGGNYKYIFKLFKIRKIFRKIKPDVINAHFLTSYGFLASIVKAHSTPLILSVHGTDIMVTPRKGLLFYLITKFTLNKANHIFSVAQHMTDQIENYIGKSSSKITTIQYGVEFDYISQINSQNRTIDFISTRNFVPNSNIEIVLKSFKEYLRTVDKLTTLYLVGDGLLTHKLKNFVKENGMLENVVFTGRIQHNEVLKLLSRSKYYISLTSSDGLSLSLLEAMVSKNIPIVSDINANREWVIDNKNGLLCSINEQSLLSCMKQVKYDNEIVTNNILKIKKFGNFDINSKKILEVINENIIYNSILPS